MFAAAFIISGCKKEELKVDTSIVGEWKLTSWSAEKPEIFEVYINFAADGTFLMYQKVETSFFTTFAGNYSAENGLISGVYSDGIPWSTEYEYSISDDGAKLTLASKTELREISVYTRTTIPEEAKKDLSTRAPIIKFRAL